MPLNRTISFPQVDLLSLAIANDLNFDMANPVEFAFDIDGAFTEGELCLGLTPMEQTREVVVFRYRAHTSPATAVDRFDDDWRTCERCLKCSCLLQSGSTLCPGDQGNVAFRSK